ncbi:hypothetical protein [Brevundimonas lutea]|uniref:hypothetical protein n=1 Tax=Brevundimonas lutea TaxID=2293980 RepID=UPI000F0178C1|nr:hypothetical protein [Brevundimonas lutea]
MTRLRQSALNLSLVAALALLPLSSALAAEPDASPTSAAEAELEAAGAAFEARMEEFGARAEAISDDDGLSEDAKGVAIAALWGEYAGDVAAFTTLATSHASLIAGEALADIDVDALVSEAMVEAGAEIAANAQGTMIGVSNMTGQMADPEMMQPLMDYAQAEIEGPMEPEED